MKYHFHNFIKQSIKQEKSESYLFILWSIYKHLNKKKRSSNGIKEEIKDLNLDNFDFLYKKKKAGELLDTLGSKQKENLIEFENLYIKYIQILNFRGFGSLHSEDKGTYIQLNRNKTIFFAPNGGGKTSLCEAFEYKLTGDIRERVKRDIRLDKYIKRQGKNPEIRIKFNTDAEKVEKDVYQYFQQCFIEKNRLQEFGFLGSKDTKVKENDVMAILLGLDELDNFISSLVLPTSLKLDEYKRETIAKDIQQIKERIQNNEKQIKALQIELARIKERNQGIIKDELDIESIKQQLEIKNEEKMKLNDEISQFRKVNIENHQESIMDLVERINSKLRVYEEFKVCLMEKINELDFSDFYSALLKAKSYVSNDLCPACDTPINKVSNNPFKKAEDELLKLKDVQGIQSEFESVENNLINQFIFRAQNELQVYMKNSQIIIKDECEELTQSIKEALDILKESQSKENKILFLKKTTLAIQKNHSDFHNYEEKLQQFIQKINQKNEVMQEYERKLKIIDELIARLSELFGTYTTITNQVVNLEKENKKFTKIIESKHEEFSKEQQYNEFLKNVETSYGHFWKDINDYKVDLEREHLLDIENDVLKYYREINKHDDKSELVENIRFTLEDEKYHILLNLHGQAEPINAFYCLSEGHMRSLGLSIMLAVAEKKKLPFLFFDDVVNAIDSDHRANIISLIFENDYLNSIQLIITTHDRLFWERFCNTYECSNTRDTKVDYISYLLNNTNKGVVVYQYNVGFKEKIEKALACFDVRQALIYCRIWFETLTVQYCVESGKEITGRFSRDKKSNLLKPSLESMYRILEVDFKDSPNLEIIRKDLINWTAQNQEHHSFDENSLNFVHSKISSEIAAIYKAVRRFAYEIEGNEILKKLEQRRGKLQVRKESFEKQLKNEAFTQKAPTHVVEAMRGNFHDVKSEIEEVSSDLFYLRHLSREEISSGS